MLNNAKYKELIFNEIKLMPDKALPKIFRLLTVIREEFVIENDEDYVTQNEDISHARTRQLLSTSKGNWANDIIADREDRV